MLEGKKPEGFEAGPTENPEDENVKMDPDDNLPWPDPALILKMVGQTSKRIYERDTLSAWQADQHRLAPARASQWSPTPPRRGRS
jgi:hypothetical protein